MVGLSNCTRQKNQPSHKTLGYLFRLFLLVLFCLWPHLTCHLKEKAMQSSSWDRDYSCNVPQPVCCCRKPSLTQWFSSRQGFVGDHSHANYSLQLSQELSACLGLKQECQVKVAPAHPQIHMEEIMRGSLACEMCLLAFASMTAVLKRLWNTLGAVMEEAFTLGVLLHFFSCERFHHRAHDRAGESTGPFKHFCNTFMWFLVRTLLLLCPIALHLTLLMSTRSTSCELASSPMLWLENLHRCLHIPPLPSSICPRGSGPGRQGRGEVETTTEKRGTTAEEGRDGSLA